MRPVTGPTFRIKPYAHPKYKFVVRAKLAGKWKRSYFRSEAEAAAYAGKQNVSLEKQVKRQRSRRVRSDGHTNGAGNWHELEKSNRRSPVSSQALSRKAVVVLGMHRSGTSALCGALDVLGVNFGKHLMPANEANPKGYREPLEIVSVHDDLLRALGSHWDDDRALPVDWLEREVTKKTQSRLLAILQRDFGQTVLLGLKDPRMSRLMPLWFPLFQKLAIDPRFVLVIRHPWEVAQSLAKRDGLDHARSYLLWLQYTLEAETVMRRHKRSFVDYDEMLDDPVAALGRVHSELKLDFRVPSRARASLRKFLEPSLRHHKARARKCEKAADRVPPLIMEVYETIRKGTTPDDVARRITPLREQLARSAGLFYPRLDVLERQVESLDQRVEKSGESALRAAELVRLDIFRAVGEEYSAGHSDARYFTSGSWKLLQIDLPGSAGAADKPLRIDPVTYPAVIDIAEMALKRPSTGEILWAATGSTEFAALTVGGTACRLAHESYLRILSFGNDPQLLLPQSTTALGDSPLRLELSILVGASPEAISASFAEMQQEPRPEVLEPAAPLMVIFADQGNGYSGEVSLAAPVQMDVSQTIRFEHLEEFHTNPRARLRIDPIDRPAFLILSSIRIIRDRDDFVLYSAESASDFEKIDVSSGILMHQEGDNLFLVTTDSDPQIYLPILDNLGTASYRLEITLEPQSAARRVTLRHRRTLEERAQLAPKLEAAQSQLEKLQAASGEWEKTFSELQASLEQARTETIQLSAQLEAERSQNHKHQAQAELDREQIASLETELRSLHRAIEEARAESAQLSSQLQTERSQNSKSAGLALDNAMLQSRLENVSRELLAAGVALKQSDAETPALVDSILADTDRIQNPSRRWKVATGFGVLRFAQPGVPRTAAGRRAIALELKAAVRKICKALSSATTAPEDAAIEITRLLELRRKTRKIVHSVNLSTLLSFASHRVFDLDYYRIWKLRRSHATERSQLPLDTVLARMGIDFEGTLENPGVEVTNEHGLLLVTGWLYLRTKKMAALSARLNGGEEVRLAHSLPRADVARHLPQFPSARDSGFEGYVPIEMGFSGRSRLEVEAVLTNGTRMRCFQREVMVKLPDPPRRREPPQELSEEDRYARWIRTNQLTPYLLKRMTRDASRIAQTGPQISIVVPTFNTPAPYLEALIESVRGQLYPNWQLCLADDASTEPHVRSILEKAAAADSRVEFSIRPANGHIVKASNSALDLAKGDYVGLLDHDDLLTPDALLHVAEAIVSERALDVQYTDEDKLSPEGKRYDPIFKGSFSPEMSLTHNYIQHFTVIRKRLLQEVGGFREGFEGALDLDLYLRVLEKTTPERVRHLPFVCYHWRSHPESTASSGGQKNYVFDSAGKSIAEALTRRCIRAVPFLPKWAKKAKCCLYQLKWSPDLLKENPVTIIIPTKNRSDLLQKCLASLERTVDAASVNVIIVDDFSEEESTRSYLKQLSSRTRLPCRVIQPRSRSAELNFSRLINEGVAAATTPLVLLLNNDTEAFDAGWLEEMAGWMSIKGVGAVGAKLLYPDHTIQHAGVIVGSHGGLADHIFHRLPEDGSGFNSLA